MKVLGLKWDHQEERRLSQGFFCDIFCDRQQLIAIIMAYRIYMMNYTPPVDFESISAKVPLSKPIPSVQYYDIFGM